MFGNPGTFHWGRALIPLLVLAAIVAAVSYFTPSPPIAHPEALPKAALLDLDEPKELAVDAGNSLLSLAKSLPASDVAVARVIPGATPAQWACPHCTFANLLHRTQTTAAGLSICELCTRTARVQ